MSVHVIAGAANKLAALRAMLEAQHTVTSELLSGTSNRCSTSDAIVATADLRVVENIAALKETFGKLGHVPKRIFLIDQRERLFTVQAYALGATRVLVNPIKQANLLPQLADRNPSETHPNDALQGAREAAAAGRDRHRRDVLRGVERQADRRPGREGRSRRHSRQHCRGRVIELA